MHIGSRVAAFTVPFHGRHGATVVVGKEQLYTTCDLVVEEHPFLIDQFFRPTVVTHRHRQVHPWPAGDEIGAERHTTHLREHEARRVTFGKFETHGLAQ